MMEREANSNDGMSPEPRPPTLGRFNSYTPGLQQNGFGNSLSRPNGIQSGGYGLQTPNNVGLNAQTPANIPGQAPQIYSPRTVYSLSAYMTNLTAFIPDDIARARLNTVPVPEPVLNPYLSNPTSGQVS